MAGEVETINYAICVHVYDHGKVHMAQMLVLESKLLHRSSLV
jgi:hypothetical protein